jgi:hypothetical protein
MPLRRRAPGDLAKRERKVTERLAHNEVHFVVHPPGLEPDLRRLVLPKLPLSRAY